MKGANRTSEVTEKEVTQAIVSGGIGVLILLTAALLLYFYNLLFPPDSVAFGRFLLAVILFTGLALILQSVYRVVRLRTLSRTPFPCPYCSHINSFVDTPDVDFECESCRRTVHFQNGEPVAIRTIICQGCLAEHRVAVTVERYLCDRCNRALQIQPETPVLSAPPLPQPRGSLLTGPAVEPDRKQDVQHCDVFVTAVQPQQDEAVAAGIERLMSVSLQDARQLLGAIGPHAPLMIGFDLPAEAARSLEQEFQRLGAVVVCRDTTAVRHATGRLD